MKDIRWGILGTGWIAGLFAEDLGRTPGARLVAVGSRDRARAADFAARYGPLTRHGSYETLVADREIDIVYIATPHSHHFEHASLAIDHGKAVLVEKPFTMTGHEARELADLAATRGTFLMEAMWTLCNPLFREIHQRVRNGDIGEPLAFNANVGPLGVGHGSRIEDPALGGSFLLECLVYPLTIAAALAPRLVDRADVSGAAILSERGVDVSSTLLLRNDAGFATVGGSFSVGAAGQVPSRVQLLGSGGWLEIADNLFNPGEVSICRAGGEPELLADARAGERYRWEIEEANRSLAAGESESPLVPLTQTIQVMELLDRCRSAIRSEVPT